MCCSEEESVQALQRGNVPLHICKAESMSVMSVRMVIQFYSKPQPGCSPKVPEGIELSRGTCSAFPTERCFSSVEVRGVLG